MNQINQLLQKTLCIITLVAIALPGSQAQTYTFQTWNNSNQPIITVTAFRSVTVDKRGTIWAGSDLGGLYYYKDSIWTKANTYIDVTFRHLVPSNLPGDNSVWATSIGKNAVQATTGGAYYINTDDFSVTQYGAGFNNGGLSSRYANSLAMSRSGKTYVALAQSLTGTTTNQGGVFVTNTNPPPPSTTSFMRAIQDTGDIIYHSAGNRGDELWFGRSGRCDNGVCQAAYIARISGNGAVLSRITAGNSPLPFTNSATSAFARAIFTDTITGNTFVGLNSGGIGVYKSDNTWKLLTSGNSPLPAGAAINFNAIAEVYGEIWIGTTMGVFVYNGTGSLDSMSSFKMLGTANGLPSTNVTDIAVDTARRQIWITSFAGVSRAPFTPPLKSIVYDVFCNKPESTLDNLVFHETFQKKPLTTGVKVKLFENGIIKDSAITNANGVFELLQAEEGKVYTVEITYTKDNQVITYKYPNIRNYTFPGSVLIPDSLIKEIKAFKPKMKERCFELDFILGISPKILCPDGFDVSTYEQAYEKFFETNGITDLHNKRVENLGDFYNSIATVYNMGGSSNELIKLGIGNLFDAIETIVGTVKLNAKMKKNPVTGVALADLKLDEFMVNDLKLKQSEFLKSLSRYTASAVSDPDTKMMIEKFYSILSEAGDLGITYLKEGRNEALSTAGINAFKNISASILSAYFYKLYYCRDVHKNFLPNATSSSRNAFSGIAYDQSYNRLYNPEGNSLVKLANDDLKSFKAEDSTYKKIARIAEYTQAAAEAASAISLLFPPGGIAASITFNRIAAAAKIAKPAALVFAMYRDVTGGFKISDASKTILSQTGFTNNRQLINRTFSPASQQTPATLLARKNLYNQKLTELKAIYNAGVYDSAGYVNKFNDFITEDSLYTDEINKTLNALWASADSAVLLVPGFNNKLGKVIDSFITPQYAKRNAFNYQNLGYRFNPNKTQDVADLNSLANEITILNDSAVNGITYLVNDINNNGISAPAYLVQETYVLNHSRVPGSTGSFTYTFKNYGTQTQNNVSFKLSTDIAAGYLFTSPDSVNVGTIMPGQTKPVTFSFTAPLTDSICLYKIDVKAANGAYQDVSGSLYVIDPDKNYSVKNGNWSDPTTWSSEVIPTNTTKAIITHEVRVDIDATCRSLTSSKPGNVTVSTGRRLTVLQ